MYSILILWLLLFQWLSIGHGQINKKNHDFPFLFCCCCCYSIVYTPTDTKPKWDDQQKVSNLAFVIFILLYFLFLNGSGEIWSKWPLPFKFYGLSMENVALACFFSCLLEIRIIIGMVKWQKIYFFGNCNCFFFVVGASFGKRKCIHFLVLSGFERLGKIIIHGYTWNRVFECFYLCSIKYIFEHSIPIRWIFVLIRIPTGDDKTTPNISTQWESL